jgi:hypothetical protein
MIATPPLPGPRLRIGDAVRDGWAAFRRSPVPFVGFSVLLILLQILCQKLQERSGLDAGNLVSDPAALTFALIGSVAGIVVNLWWITGLVRGAWAALEGGRPNFATLMRWDGPANLRLFLPQLLLGLLFVVAALVLGIVAIVLYQLSPFLSLAPMLVLLVLVVYLVVNQNFLAQVALLEGSGPLATLQRGREAVDPEWGQVALLALLEVALLIAGLLVFLVGFLVAWPVLVCISTAAYRQLFGASDKAGLLAAGEVAASSADTWN